MSDCILWTGRVAGNGYGMDGRRLAHRVAWEREHGEIPSGMHVHHDCGERLCVNVSHMRLLTPAEHALEHGTRRGFMDLVEERKARTHCPQGHEYTPENTLIKRGKRHCRECARAYSRAYHAKNRDRLLPLMRERARKASA